MFLRIQSVVPEEVDALIRKIIGCAIEVHRRLGPGLREAIYEDALTIELKFNGLKFDCQREVNLHYRGEILRAQRIDLVVENAVLVEIKAVNALHLAHRSQVISYLRATGLKVGLLINFNGEMIAGNVKRIVL